MKKLVQARVINGKELGIRTVTKHHNTGYLLTAKGRNEGSGSYLFDRVIDLSINNMKFLLM